MVQNNQLHQKNKLRISFPQNVIPSKSQLSEKYIHQSVDDVLTNVITILNSSDITPSVDMHKMYTTVENIFRTSRNASLDLWRSIQIEIQTNMKLPNSDSELLGWSSAFEIKLASLLVGLTYIDRGILQQGAEPWIRNTIEERFENEGVFQSAAVLALRGQWAHGLIRPKYAIWILNTVDWQNFETTVTAIPIKYQKEALDGLNSDKIKMKLKHTLEEDDIQGMEILGRWCKNRSLHIFEMMAGEVLESILLSDLHSIADTWKKISHLAQVLGSRVNLIAKKKWTSMNADETAIKSIIMGIDHCNSALSSKKCQNEISDIKTVWNVVDNKKELGSQLVKLLLQLIIRKGVYLNPTLLTHIEEISNEDLKRKIKALTIGFEQSNNLYNAFRSLQVSETDFSLDKESQKLLPHFKPHVFSLRMMIEQMYNPMDIPSLPSPLSDLREQYEKFHKKKFPSYKLTWAPEMDSLVLKYDAKELTVNFFQALILLRFSHKSPSTWITYRELIDETQIPKLHFDRALHSLVNGKVRILEAIRHNRAIPSKAELMRIERFNQLDTFRPLASIPTSRTSINLSTYKTGSSKPVNMKVDSIPLLQARIVRVMKHHIRLRHSQLLLELGVETKSLKKALQGLMEPGNAYICRDLEDPNVYIYKP